MLNRPKRFSLFKNQYQISIETNQTFPPSANVAVFFGDVPTVSLCCPLLRSSGTCVSIVAVDGL